MVRINIDMSRPVTAVARNIVALCVTAKTSSHTCNITGHVDLGQKRRSTNG